VEKALKAAPIWTTEIFDPVEGFAYLLDDQQKIAHRMAMQPSQLQLVAAHEGGIVPQTATEKLGAQTLGAQTIEGVLAEGTRTTATVALGAEGNGHPHR
jgi:hypothetical protein